ncbi:MULTISPECIES: hypothetical protein [unclassified Mesorhizobium]|uniref:hypothetical protein n=1 Tax=unclassified Mesorhizobium TaxID=325217 RepID=UPI0033388283
MIIGKVGPDYYVVEGAISVAASVRPLDAAERRQVALWLDLNQVSHNVDLQTVVFENAAPHAGALQPLLADIRARLGGSDLSILYLHRGHQLDTRSPILQWLLPLVGGTGPVFALRVDDEIARQDATTMARALLHRHGRVLVLTDETRRLGPHEAAAPVITYTVLVKGSIETDPTMASPGQAVVENLEVRL